MHEKIKLQGRTPFPIEQVYKWFLQTALVLHHLHQKKVIHRDIKPQNLFLDEVFLSVICWLEKWYQSWWLRDLSSPPVHSRHGPNSSRNSFICSTWSGERDALWFASWCVVDGLYVLRNTDTHSTLHGTKHVWLDVPSEGRRLSAHRCALRVGVMWTVDSSPDLRNIIHSMLQVDPK